MTNLEELWRRGEHGPSEPHGVSLHFVRDHVHVDRLRLYPSPAQLLRDLEPVVDDPHHIALHPLAEVLEHSRATAQHNVVVEGAPHVDGTVLDHCVHHLRYGDCEVGVRELTETKRSIIKKQFHV